MVATLAKKTAQDPERNPVVLAHRYSESLRIEKPVFHMDTGVHYLEQVKRIRIRFPESLVRKWGRLELIHITDVQYCHVLCKQSAIDRLKGWVLDAPNRFVLFGGDMVDAWRLGSPGSPFENTGEPQTQVYRFCAEFAPIAHRVIGYVGGNHERRAALAFGDLGTLVSSILKLAYSAGQQFIDIEFGDWKRKPFGIDLFHGRGAARTKGAKCGMLYEFMRHSDADCCLVGHLHDAIALYRWIRERDVNNLGLRFRRQGGAMSSSFLEWVGSYAEVSDLEATDCLMAKITLNANGTWSLSHF